MRDREKWRERVEISLDSRQIFLLFCAVTLVTSLVFALGVIVGKRLRPTVEDEPRMDPLALLDQFGQGDQQEGRLDVSHLVALDAGSASDDAGSAASPRTRSAAVVRPAEGSVAEQGDYTLQLSSFQDRLEAEQFSKKLRDAGLEVRIVPAQIPNRGLWFRVRLGSYESWEQAVAAKEAFEREHDLIAYVARR